MKKMVLLVFAMWLCVPGAADQADLARFDSVVGYLVETARAQPTQESLLTTARGSLPQTSMDLRDALRSADDRGELQATIIKALLKTLDDPWARLYTPDEVAALRERMSGDRKSSMGVVVVPQTAPICYRVVGVSPQSPAAGKLFPGDSIIWANGLDAKDEKFLDTIKGESGQVNRLKVRDEQGTVREVSVTLRDFDAPTAYVESKEKGIIRVTSFGPETADELKQAMAELDGKPAILDLRFNGGGYVTAAVASSDLFLHRGDKVVTTVSPKKKEVHIALHDVTYHQPVCILVNGRTASAAEIFTAALKINNKAYVVGDKTYGKGSVQRLVSLPGNWALKYTTSLYQTPDGVFIAKIGLHPDTEIDMELALSSSSKDKQLAAALAWAEKAGTLAKR